MTLDRHHIRLALRRLGRAPVFAGVSLATLAVGIGATVAIFAVVNSILLRPLPYPAADRLVSILHTAPGLGTTELPQSDASFFVYHDGSGEHRHPPGRSRPRDSAERPAGNI